MLWHETSMQIINDIYFHEDDLTRDTKKRDLLGNKHQTGIHNFLEKHSIVFVCINTY
jgi:hypothetical protein